MTKLKKRILPFIFLLFFTLSFLCSHPAYANNSDEERVYQSVREAVQSLMSSKEVAVYGTEWFALDLARDDQTFSEFYLKDLVDTIITKEGVLHTGDGRSDYTNYAKAVLVLTALGVDASNVAGYDLIERVSHFPLVRQQGLNGVIYALLALDCHNFPINPPEDLPMDVTRESYINALLLGQLEDGGWDYANKQADPDMTAMAIQALAPYYETNENVKASIDKALNTLSTLQQPDGGFLTEDAAFAESSESTSMVILALTALGIDPTTDPRFIKNGYTAIDNLCSFAVEGGFKHTQDGRYNAMATDQGYRALVAYERLKNGKTSFYDMTDKGELITLTTALAFNDVLDLNAWYFQTVYQIAGRVNEKGHALMSGYSNGSGNFGPADPLTRQDFAVILYRLDNEPEIPEMDNPFLDTKEDGYYYDCVLWAKANNVIAGYNDGRFGVGDKITREQVATILYRFATDYLKLDTSAASEAGDLSKFNDGTAISEWAEAALTWATGAGIITGKSGGTEIAARGNAARAEIGAMILRFINYRANLESSSSK